MNGRRARQARKIAALLRSKGKAVTDNHTKELVREAYKNITSKGNN